MKIFARSTWRAGSVLLFENFDRIWYTESDIKMGAGFNGIVGISLHFFHYAIYSDVSLLFTQKLMQ